MIQIFAHRAVLNSKENTLEGIQNCIRLNIGLEIDLRYDKDVYLSHDENKNYQFFEDTCKILSLTKTKIVLHVKEIQAIKEVVRLVNKYSINQNCIIFMDTVDYLQLVGLAGKDVEVAYYASYKPMNYKPIIYWCDELADNWYDKNIIDSLHKNNKIMYAMSKELIHRTDLDEIKKEWGRLLDLGFDGICTDYPLKLRSFIKERGR